jgi:hypothetical protein
VAKLVFDIKSLSMAETEIVVPPRRIIEHLERHNHATRVNHAPVGTWY